jgi:membrane glycosyltransferase
MRGVALRRAGVGVVCLAVASGLAYAFLGTLPRVAGIDILRAALVFASGAWLAWGCALALLGLGWSPPAPPRGAPAGRTAILMPICNEDAAATVARIGAVRASLEASGHAHLFEFAVLSDSRPEVAREEQRRLEALLALAPGAPLHYRRRADRRGRKAGNIAEFLRTAGGRFRYAVVLDADSLVEGDTLVEMVRRMEGDPGLGLLQTVPLVLGARTRFGRVMQFASHLTGPLQARGLAALQGREGPYWGHNAIFRVAPFAAHCGLAPLPGTPPLGGDILSHDYVEGALLARAGWRVRLDPDLAGSFEEAPQDIVEHARRDRRWCQGNLQHGRLIGLGGLGGWSRLSFFLNLCAYAMAPVWALFLLASLLRPLATGTEPHAAFPTGFEGLVFAVICLLVLPRLAALAHELARPGRVPRARLLAGALAELAFSALLAPILLAYQIRAVLEVLRGRDAGWPASERDGRPLTLAEAWEATGWVTTLGIAGLALTVAAALGSLYFVLPVFLPMLFAPVLAAWSSRGPAAGGLLGVGSERGVPEVARLRDDLLSA